MQGHQQVHGVSANRILWVYAGFWWYHGILVAHLQDSVGAFWAIKDRGISIRCISVENVMADGLSRVCSWWCTIFFPLPKVLVYILRAISVKTCPQCHGNGALATTRGMLFLFYIILCVCVPSLCSHAWQFTLHSDFPQPFVKTKSFRSHISESWC